MDCPVLAFQFGRALIAFIAGLYLLIMLSVPPQK